MVKSADEVGRRRAQRLRDLERDEAAVRRANAEALVPQFKEQGVIAQQLEIQYAKAMNNMAGLVGRMKDGGMTAAEIADAAEVDVRVVRRLMFRRVDEPTST